MKKHLSKLKRHYIPKSTKLYEQQNPVYHGVHLPNRSVEMRGGCDYKRPTGHVKTAALLYGRIER